MDVIALFLFLFVVGAIYVFIHCSRSSSDDSHIGQSGADYTNDPYVQSALEFLKFYRCLSEKGKPRVILTEEYIGVMFQDDTLGIGIQTCLGGKNRGDSEVFETAKNMFVLPQIDALSSNGDGSKLFTSLSLDMHLHDNDADYPVILKWLFCKDILDRKKYIKIIERQYEQIYRENIHIISWVTW